MLRKLKSDVCSGLESKAIAALGREGKTPLYTVLGLVTGIRHNHSDEYGDSFGLVGQFESTSLHTGEVNQAPVYWPPKFLAEIISGEFSAGNDDPGFKLRLAYEVGVQKSTGSQNTMGFEYYVDPVRELGAADPFEDLREAMAERIESLQIEDKSGDEDATPPKKTAAKRK